MSKLKENLEFQKETNNVIETLMKHFGEETSLSAYYEEMASAQSQIMSVMLAADDFFHSHHCHEEVLTPKDVANFFSDINELFKMLKPLDHIANMK